MEIKDVYGCPYEDKEGEVLNIHVSLDENEKISLGDTVKIEMMDGTYLEREVKIINPNYAGDYAAVSENVRLAGWKKSDKPILSVTGKCLCRIVVMNVPYHEVKTEREIEERKMRAEMESKFWLTPYKELHMGDESIYDHTDETFEVPNKVILYLQTKELYLLSPGIYQHPFKKDMELLGPYIYSDGYYCWDRDTWKYVVKYGLTLPKKFIDYVMSDEADGFLAKTHNSNWPLQKRENSLNLLPEDSGDIPLEKF